MRKLFVPYELAVKLKELGFNEPCLARYYNNGKEFILKPTANNLVGSYVVLTPLYQQVFDWFREEHNIHSYINLTNIQGRLTYHVNICSVDKHEVGVSRVTLCNLFDFKTYEEALERGLLEALELIPLLEKSTDTL